MFPLPTGNYTLLRRKEAIEFQVSFQTRDGNKNVLIPYNCDEMKMIDFGTWEVAYGLVMFGVKEVIWRIFSEK
eukprot:6657625-Ditylum_brightwellii.AAC.1